MNRHEKRVRTRLANDLPYYAKVNLKIRAKDTAEGEKIRPFIFNRAQKYLHKKIEEQRSRTGKVRVILLKGRQMGASTYISARYYHKSTHKTGLKCFILAHLDDATSNLFTLAKRYHKHSSLALLPSTSNSSKRELVFDKLDSAYSLGTAGSGNVGRSDTIDLLHCSEAAFFKNPASIKTGVMQAASAATEIIVESTANGFDAFFQPMWRAAQGGISEYEAIFMPWWWMTEYAINVPDDFEMTKDEAEMLALYINDGMTLQNVAWYRNKLNSDFGGDITLMRQEFPNTAHEAFQVTGIESFIKPEVVIKARKTTEARKTGVHIVGIDPARGGDRTAFMHRNGYRMWKGPIIKTPDVKVIQGMIKELFEGKEPADWVFLDIGGLGGPIYDNVKDLEFGHCVIPVNFGSEGDVINKERYKNKRAEMIGEFKQWLEDDTNRASIPDDDDFQADICAPSWTYDNRQRILMESKKDMKSRGIISTDLLDAAALTFAKPMGKRANSDISGIDTSVPIMIV